MDYYDRRGSRPRTFERSASYSAAIGNSYDNSSVRSSIEIPNIINTEVYLNEEIKRHRNSVIPNDVKEFARILRDRSDEIINCESDDLSSNESENECNARGLIMKIDEENVTNNSSPNTVYKNTSISGQELDNIYAENIYALPESIITSSHGYSASPYSRRIKGPKKRRKHQVGRSVLSRRVIHKNGEENVPIRGKLPGQSMKYLRDTVHTIINSKWRCVILLMVLAHFIMWLLFAGIWYAVTISYQDDIDDGKEHCVTGTSSFAGLLMMAVETQMTIGYGLRYPNEECPEAIVIMILELVASTAISGALPSLLFLKLIRPNRHIKGVGFSKKATVCMRDGELCLTFRVWDLMNYHIIKGEVTAYILKPIRTLEGENMQNYVHQLSLKGAKAFLLWPITVVHVIDCMSPLYDFSAQDMMDYRFEIIVCLTGASKNLGAVSQSRTSYLSKEIIWGHRFKNVLNYSTENESYVVDVDNLDTTEQVDTPLCSANQLKEFQQDMQRPEHTPSSISRSSRSRPSNNSYGWSYKEYSSKRQRYIESQL